MSMARLPLERVLLTLNVSPDLDSKIVEGSEEGVTLRVFLL